TFDLFENTGRLFHRALESLTQEDCLKRPREANPMIWLAGHLTLSRCGLASFLGARCPRPWKPLFGRYSQLVEAGRYPHIGEVAAAFDQATARARKRFGELGPQDLTAAVPADRFPTDVQSLEDGIDFLLWHEAYHIGQMAYLRKWLGYEGLIDGAPGAHPSG
ncbi:MAG: DinB family protein, partial [Acidobacteriota bacterium]